MSLEALTAFASVGTLFVIGATAIFAAIQLRHARALGVSQRAQGQAVFENFEYMVTLGEDFVIRYPAGTYPRNHRRKRVEDVWLNADQAEGVIQP